MCLSKLLWLWDDSRADCLPEIEVIGCEICAEKREEALPRHKVLCTKGSNKQFQFHWAEIAAKKMLWIRAANWFTCR